MRNLEQLGNEIHQCDDKIISALVERMRLIENVISYKKEHNIPIFQREQNEIQQNILKEKLTNHCFENEILDIFSHIVKNSKKVQTKSLFSQNIMLIGFMGTGKSTVAAYLSQMLAMEVVEMDAMIVEKEQMSINEIFEKYGEDYFRDVESKTIVELQGKSQLVVSCGGGVVLRDENIKNMKKNGRIVLLTASPETIYERVKDSTERPILNNQMNVSFISELMEKRRERYLQAADIMIDTDHKKVEEICEEMVERLSAMNEM